MPSSKDTKWYAKCREAGAHIVTITGGRIQFDKPIPYEGEEPKKISSNTGGSMLIVFTPRGVWDFLGSKLHEIPLPTLRELGNMAMEEEHRFVVETIDESVI